MITVTGRLLDDARAATTGAQHSAVIVLTIDAGGLPVEVRHYVGDTPESHINAERLANAMPRGCVAAATADRIDYCADHGVARFVLRSPTAIRVGGWELL